MARHKFLLTEFITILCVFGLVAIGFFSMPYLAETILTRRIISAMTELEDNVYTFYTSYSYLPGDMPKATQYWDVRDFDNLCDYWTKNSDSSGKPRVLHVFKGFNGDGNGLISLSATERIGTDTFSEISGVGCHLRLAKILGYRPVVLRDYNQYRDGLWYHPVTGLNNVGLIVGEVSMQLVNNVDNVDTSINQIQIVSNTGNSRITSRQAMLLDKKVDDGMPGTGRMRCNSFNKNLACCDKHVNGICRPDAQYLQQNENYAAYLTYNSRIIEKLHN